MTRVVHSQIRILKSRAEIETLREFWTCCNPGRDADLDFYLFIIEHYPQTQRPHVIVLYEGDAPKALLAGRLDLTTLPVRVGYFLLSVPTLRILQFVHGGWLGNISESSAKLLVGSVVDSLAAGEADAALLHYPNLSSPLVYWAARLPRWLCVDHFVRPQAHRIREFSAGDGAFVPSLSQNARYQQRKRARKINQDFTGCALSRFTKLEDVEDLMRDAETVAKKSYQRGLGTGFFSIPTTRARLEFEARAGWLRAYILYLDKRPCAFWIGSLRNGTFLSDYLAFDPAYSHYAPGLYLTMNVMEELYGDGPDAVRRVDFGIGDATYKERLSNRQWHESPVYIFAPSLKGMATNALRSAAGLLDGSAKFFVGMTALQGTIKRTWRTRVTERE